MENILKLNILITNFNLTDDETTRETILDEMGSLITDTFEIEGRYRFWNTDPARTKLGILQLVEVSMEEGVIYWVDMDDEEELVKYQYAKPA